MSPSTKKNAPKRAFLSDADVTRLMSETSSETRIDVLDKIAGAYHTEGFTPKEIALAEQIFRLMLRDTETKVRARLAENVRSNPNIPRDIVLNLVRDVEEVALPIIECSEVLSDYDLTEIIRTSYDQSRRKAVARRKHVSARVARSLIETREEAVVHALVDNPGAEICTLGYQRIMDDFPQHQAILASMAQRESLPLTVVERLVTYVSDAIARKLEAKYQKSQTELGFEAEQMREEVTLRLVSNNTDVESVDKLVNQLYAFGRLSPSMIFSALCSGNMRFFEAGMARLAQLPLKNVRTLLADQGDGGFRALYAKAQLPESMCDVARLTLRGIQALQQEQQHPGSGSYANRLAERVMMLSERKPVENLHYVLALIRQKAA